MANADTKIAQIEAIIGYTFTKKLLCAEGLQMDGTPGCVWLGRTPHMVEKNTRLAVLGDAIMASVLVEKWYDHRNAQGASLDKDQWDQLRQGLLSNGNLAALGRTHGIDAAILTNAGTRLTSTKMVATTVEAIVGAAYLDAGENGLTVVGNIMENLGLFNHPLLLFPGTGGHRVLHKAFLGIAHTKHPWILLSSTLYIPCLSSLSLRDRWGAAASAQGLGQMDHTALLRRILRCLY